MNINAKTIIGLPVVTAAGLKIGRVADLEINADSHAVSRYVVSTGLLGRDVYLIAPGQVVSISAKRLVVDDGVLKERRLAAKKTAPAPTGVLGNVVS